MKQFQVGCLYVNNDMVYENKDVKTAEEACALLKALMAPEMDQKLVEAESKAKKSTLRTPAFAVGYSYPDGEAGLNVERTVDCWMYLWSVSKYRKAAGFIPLPAKTRSTDFKENATYEDLCREIRRGFTDSVDKVNV